MLYPAWSELLGFPDAAAPMIHDHEAIVARIDELARVGVHDSTRSRSCCTGSTR